MNISENLLKIQSTIPANVKLVAVSKTKPNEYVEEIYNAGQRVFGENRPKELKQKHEDLPKDIEWHFIGHPQSKQVKYFAEFVQLIHGVENIKLLQVINKEGVKHNRVINVLLQFYIAQEETKFGLDLIEANALLHSDEFKEINNVKVVGVMGMATYTDDIEQIRSEFKNLNQIFTELKQGFFAGDESFKEISMGMSGDYEIAIEEGSTMVRVGSSIFGVRNYL
ncbi:MAG: YggS family pyridoxal phosphate-dependent enzyme [Salinivirgaceae bacterium]|jgi:pyridoxal phosphate enzyme (YggS family)|nr:YggS family pyridoxal phosphate-dependent enzyme [Salinivirgaceae bacterium]